MEKYDLLLAKLGSDRTAGSELLIASALEIIRSAAGDNNISDDELAKVFQSLIDIIKGKFAELSPMIKLAARIEGLPKANLRESAIEIERNLRMKIARESSSLSRIGANLIGQNYTVATISHSETILNIVYMARGLSKDFHVIAAISDPAKEGKIAAKHIAGRGIPVTLVPDAAIGYAVEKADIALVGADSVSEEFFLNKVGTLPMALAAKHFHVPFYVCARLAKFTPARMLPESRQYIGPGELDPPESDLITASAPLFEKVPNSLVTGIVTESGIITPERGRIDISEVVS